MDDKQLYDLYKSLDDDAPINVSISITKKQLREILKEEIEQLGKSNDHKKLPYREPTPKGDEASSPYKEKAYLTLYEASKIYNIGIGKLRKMSNEKKCPYVLFVGNKRLIKRKIFEEYMDKAYSI